MTFSRLSLVALAAATLIAGVANASPVVLGKTGGVFNVQTGAIYSSDGSASNWTGTYFNAGQIGGQTFGQVLQNSLTDNPYLTDAVVFNRVNATTVTITMETLFNGVEAVGSSAVHYADLFITPPTPGNPSVPNANWTYGIGLGGAITNVGAVAGAGGQGLNGGVAAGVYQIGGPANYRTSEQVWSGRGGFIIGGDVTSTADVNSNNPANIFDPPTQIVAGTPRVGGLMVGVTQTNSGSFVGYNQNVGVNYFDVIVTLTDTNAGGANLNSLFTSFDLFWGTGDCSNDAIWGSVQTVPAPGALALLGLGLAGLARRRRAAK